MNDIISLGKCRIKYGKSTRNYFTYFYEHRMIQIDFDSDYSLYLEIPNSNPKKAFNKAKKIVDKLINCDITVEELAKIGFSHDIPNKRFKAE